MLKINYNNPIISEDMQEIYARLPESELLKNSSIYITGASGMLASYMTSYLIWLNEKYDYGIQIYAGIRKKEKALARFGHYVSKDYFHCINSDVIDPLSQSVNNIFFNYIIHAASFASPQYYGCKPVETILPNVIGTYNLLEYSKEHPVKGFLFFSSESTYGKVDTDQSTGIIESNIGVLNFLDPGSKYGESKRTGEMICHSYFCEYNIPTVSGRISHTYGPTMNVKGDSRVFAEFVNNVLESRNIEMKSDGSAVRQFAYITDTVTGLYKMLLKGTRGEAYNVGNDHEVHSILELAEMMTSLRPEKGLKVIRVERKDDGYKTSNGHNTTFISTKKLESLGWNANHTTYDGFDRTIRAIEWDQEHG